MAANTFPILRGPDAQQSRTQDNVNQVLAPVARALQNTPIMGAPAPAYIRPSLLNGFTDYGAGTAGAAFHRDALGYVHVIGLVLTAAGAAATTTIFVLPLGYRPAAARIFVVESGAAHQSVNVLPSGVVSNRIVIGAGGNMTLEFSFLAEQ